MHKLISDTIDKVSFKVNIPIMITIVSSVAVVLSWYFSLMNDMNMIKLGIAQIIEKQTQDMKVHVIIDDRLKNLEDKVLIIQTREGIK